jgi:hypothetical protein
VELARQEEGFRRQGLGLASVIPEPVATLREFAARHGIRYPILADVGSVVVRRYGLIDASFVSDSVEDVPYAGTFLLDARGVVEGKYFESETENRRTGASLLMLQGAQGTPAGEARAEHFAVKTAQSNTEAAPGQRITLALDFELQDKHHFYAPGRHEYRALALRLAPDPLLEVHETVWPSPRPYLFAPLQETVPVYEGRFRSTTDVTLLFRPSLERLKAGDTAVTLDATLDYQVCSDTTCYPPATLPLSWRVTLRPWVR